MGFFEFADEFNEAVTARPAPARAKAPASTSSRPASTSATARPSTRPSPTTKTTSASTPATSNTKSATTKTAPSKSPPTKPAATTKAASPAKPGASPAKPSSTSSSSSDGSSGKSKGFSFDAFGKLVPQLVDFGKIGVQVYQQFAQPGGAAPAPAASAQPAPEPPSTSGAPIASPEPAAATPTPPTSGGVEAPASPASPWAQLNPSYSTAPAPQPYVATPSPYPVQAVTTGVDQLGLLLQALRQHQVPPLPSPPAYYGAPLPHPRQPDGLALLRTILTNPHLQQALQAGVAHTAGTRTLALPVPSTSAPGQTRSVAIPMGAVMNAIATLAGQSMSELNETTAEDEPEVPVYLVDDAGDFLVDPASGSDRAALVAHWFRVSEAAEQVAATRRPSRLAEAAGEQDESEMWMREAGFAK